MRKLKAFLFDRPDGSGLSREKIIDIVRIVLTLLVAINVLPEAFRIEDFISDAEAASAALLNGYNIAAGLVIMVLSALRTHLARGRGA